MKKKKALKLFFPRTAKLMKENCPYWGGFQEAYLKDKKELITTMENEALVGCWIDSDFPFAQLGIEFCVEVGRAEKKVNRFVKKLMERQRRRIVRRSVFSAQLIGFINLKGLTYRGARDRFRRVYRKRNGYSPDLKDYGGNVFHKWVSGRATPSREELICLSEVLGCKIEDLSPSMSDKRKA